MNIGCYTGPWGPNGFVEAITRIAECGFDGVECPASIVHSYEDRLHVFQEILESADLQFGGILQQVDLLDADNADEQVERAANSARFASSAGARTLTVCHNAVYNENLDDEDWATIGAIAEEIGARCSEFGITLCVLPRAQRLVSTERDIKRLMASTNPEFVKLAVDTAEIVLAGSNPQRVVKSNLDRLELVRFRDASASKRRSKSTSAKPGSTPQFGRGAVNFEGLCKILLNGGYSGWIVLDITGDSQSPAEAIDSGYRFLVRKSGLFSL